MRDVLVTFVSHFVSYVTKRPLLVTFRKPIVRGYSATVWRHLSLYGVMSKRVLLLFVSEVAIDDLRSLQGS